jgi:hypothetical protein
VQKAIRVREEQVPFCREEKTMNDCERLAGFWLQKKRPGSNASGRQKPAGLREDREMLLARLRVR